MVKTSWADRVVPMSVERSLKKARRKARRARRLAKAQAKSASPKKAAPKPPKATRHKFYATPEWKRLRYETLVKYGGRCMACGVSAEDGARINIDHIEPISAAWHRRLDPTNLQVLCGSCNAGKGGRDQTDWRPGSKPAPIPRIPSDDEIHRGNPFFYR